MLGMLTWLQRVSDIETVLWDVVLVMFTCWCFACDRQSVDVSMFWGRGLYCSSWSAKRRGSRTSKHDARPVWLKRIGRWGVALAQPRAKTVAACDHGLQLYFPSVFVKIVKTVQPVWKPCETSVKPIAKIVKPVDSPFKLKTKYYISFIWGKRTGFTGFTPFATGFKTGSQRSSPVFTQTRWFSPSFAKMF